jgi:hypothetical protein
MRMAQAISVLKAIATNRVTYRFLAALLTALGLAQGTAISSGLETAACILLGGCGQ